MRKFCASLYFWIQTNDILLLLGHLHLATLNFDVLRRCATSGNRNGCFCFFVFCEFVWKKCEFAEFIYYLCYLMGHLVNILSNCNVFWSQFIVLPPKRKVFQMLVRNFPFPRLSFVLKNSPPLGSRPRTPAFFENIAKRPKSTRSASMICAQRSWKRCKPITVCPPIRNVVSLWFWPPSWPSEWCRFTGSRLRFFTVQF